MRNKSTPQPSHAPTQTPTSLTAAERRYLGNILALGGAHETGNGADHRGAVRYNVVLRLLTRGLVERGSVKALAQGAADRGLPRPRGTRRAEAHAASLGMTYADTTRETFYATALGCLAFGDEIARVS